MALFLLSVSLMGCARDEKTVEPKEDVLIFVLENQSELKLKTMGMIYGEKDNYFSSMAAEHADSTLFEKDEIVVLEIGKEDLLDHNPKKMSFRVVAESESTGYETELENIGFETGKVYRYLLTGDTTLEVRQK